MLINKKNGSLTILTILFLGILTSWAQKNIMHGKVTLFNVIAVEKAEITVKKSQISVLSDSLGLFSIECSKKDKLTISAVGFKKKQVKILNPNDSIIVNLKIAGNVGDINLAVAEGHINVRDVDLAIKYYNTKPPYSIGYTTMIELILGKYPSVDLLMGNSLLEDLIRLMIEMEH